MEVTKFTPGPWVAHQNWAHEPGVDPKHPNWCEVTGPSMDPESRFSTLSISGHFGIANARLISAAPDLYEAADDVDAFVSQSELDGADERVIPVMMTLGTIRKFRAALLKAVPNCPPQAVAAEVSSREDK